VPKDDKDDLSYLVTDTGFRVPLSCVKVTDKTSLCKAVREYHTIIKILPEVNQFGEGLEVLGVLTMMRKYPELLSDYFIDKEKKPINKGMLVAIQMRSIINCFIASAFFKGFLKPQFVDHGNPLRAKQEKAFMYFLDFVDECEGMTFLYLRVICSIHTYIDREVLTPNGKTVLPEHILIFFTGTDRVPPLGFDSTASMRFISGVLATSSTCNMVMNLPYCHEMFETFKSYMIESLLSNGGFNLL